MIEPGGGGPTEPEPDAVSDVQPLTEPDAVSDGQLAPEATPPPEPDATPAPPAMADQAIDIALRFGVVALIVAASVAIALATGVIRRADPPTRPLPTPLRQAIVLVPIGDFPTAEAVAIRDRLHAAYDIPMTVAAPIGVDPASADPGTGQLVGERLIDQLAVLHPEWQNDVVVIGLTVDDLRLDARPDWRFAFSYRVDQGIAVVSAARMTRILDAGDRARWNRLTKMVTRQVAFLHYGLQANGNRSDLLYNNILSVDDIDRMADHL